MTFGQFIKELRVKRNYTIRRFCIEHNLDNGNYSKLERGILSPPQHEDNLKTLALALGLSEKTEDWYKLFDLAIVVGNGRIPDYIMKDKEVLNRLPLFFRIIASDKNNKERLDKIIELIKIS